MGVQENRPCRYGIAPAMHKCALRKLGMALTTTGVSHTRNCVGRGVMTLLVSRRHHQVPPMPRPTTTDRLETLRRKRDQLDEQLKALEARKKETERKADTRRKVIAGALALEHFEANRESEFGRILFRLLDEYVVRPHDRALFPYLPESEQPPSDDTGSEFIRAGREAGGSAPSPTP